MFQNTIDAAHVLTILCDVVEEVGADHIDPKSQDNTRSCSYLSDETLFIDRHIAPACIVGHVFHRLGILRAVLGDVGDQLGACSLGGKMFENAKMMGVEFTDDAVRVLRSAQARQDSADTWGKALSAALVTAKRLERERLMRYSIVLSENMAERVSALTDPTSAAAPSEPVEPMAEWERELLAMADNAS